MLDLLSFDCVKKRYKNVIALQALSISIPKNKIIGLIGANGAGKTTIMKLITRYLLPDSGSIYFNQQEIQKIPNTNYPISFIPDVPICYEELSVLEHLVLVSTMYNTESKKDGLINILELEEHLDKVPAILSRGNRQKLSIACALLRNYDLLLADEPFSGLDPKQIKVLKDLFLKERDDGKTVIISSHLLDIIEPICDEFIIIDHGRILGQGGLSQIISGGTAFTSLEEIYLFLSSKKAIDE